MESPSRPSRDGRFSRWIEKFGIISGFFRTSETAEGGGLPRFFPIFLLLFAAGMGLITLVGDQGLISYSRLQTEAEQLREDVAALKQRREELVREIRALRQDGAYIELLARQKLGLVKPGETVIQLPLNSKQP